MISLVFLILLLLSDMCLCPITIKNRSKYVDLHHMSVEFTVPCGKCIECVQDKTNEYIFRSIQEYQECVDAGGYAYFDTLTHTLLSEPSTGGILSIPCFDRTYVTKFFKKLRKNIERKHDIDIDGKLTYFVTSEYGGDDHHPHYHIILFVKTPDLPVRLLRSEMELAWSSPIIVNGKKLTGKYRSDIPDEIVQQYLDMRVLLSSARGRILHPELWNLKLQDLLDDSGTHIINTPVVPLGILDCKKSFEERVVNSVGGCIEYIAKYAYKDDAYMGFVRGRNETLRGLFSGFYSQSDESYQNLREFYNLPEFNEEEFEKAKAELDSFVESQRSFEPFHQSSQRFGGYFLDRLEDASFDFDEYRKAILKGDNLSFKVHDKNSVTGTRLQKIALPKYYERKLFYDRVTDADGDHWRLNEAGILHALDLYDKKISVIADRFQKILDNANQYDPINGEYIRNEILRLMGNRTLDDFAEYLFTYKNHLTKSALYFRDGKKFYEDTLRGENITPNILREIQYTDFLHEIYSLGYRLIDQDFGKSMVTNCFVHYDTIFSMFTDITISYNRHLSDLWKERQRLQKKRKKSYHEANSHLTLYSYANVSSS